MLGLRVVHDPAQQWERFGRMDPYYGVYTVADFRHDNLDDAALERFFTSGEEHVVRILEWVRRHVVPDFAPRTVLDHGCGVGRLLIPFARRAERVVGVDVAPSMLAEARRNCDAHGVHNVELLEAARLGQLGARFDLVNSFIVLQHIPPRQGERIFATLASLVAPGGVGVVHVPIAPRHWLARAHTWTTRRVPFAYNVANLLRGRPWSYPHMQMNAYKLNALAAHLLRQGYDRLHLEIHPGHSRLTYAAALLFFARSADHAAAARARS